METAQALFIFASLSARLAGVWQLIHLFIRARSRARPICEGLVLRYHEATTTCMLLGAAWGDLNNNFAIGLSFGSGVVVNAALLLVVATERGEFGSIFKIVSVAGLIAASIGMVKISPLRSELIVGSWLVVANIQFLVGLREKVLLAQANLSSGLSLGSELLLLLKELLVLPYLFTIELIDSWPLLSSSLVVLFLRLKLVRALVNGGAHAVLQT
jgi:hypothetical protein